MSCLNPLAYVRSQFPAEILISLASVHLLWKFSSPSVASHWSAILNFAKAKPEVALGQNESWFKIQDEKTFCASFCASLIAGSRRAFLCVDWPCRLCLFVKCTRCERLLLIEVCKAFLFVLLLLLLLFFGHLKITLDLEQPMLKGERIIPSVWGGINVLNTFTEASIFLLIVHSSCELILCPVLRLPSPGWIKTRLYSVSSYGFFFYMPRIFNLPSRCRTNFIPVFSQRNILLTHASELKLVPLKLSRK